MTWPTTPPYHARMRTDELLDDICAALSRNCGDLHAAALENGITPHFLNTWIKEDKEAADRLLEAQRTGWLGLESAAIKRAVQGVEEDVWFKGEVVGTKINYSDMLLSRLLEARVPAFNKRDASTTTFNGPTQINIMPRADSYEDWLAMKDATLDPARNALPAPQQKLPEILQGEYVEISEEDQRPLAHLKDLGL